MSSPVVSYDYSTIEKNLMETWDELDNKGDSDKDDG